MKKIIFIDYYLTSKTPSSKSLSMAIPFFIEKKLSIEFWGFKIDKNLEKYVKKRIFPNIKLPVFGNILNWFTLNLFGTINYIGHKNKKNCFWITTGGHFLLANGSIFHFYNPWWLSIQNKGIEFGPESKYRKLLCLWGVIEEKIFLNLSKNKKICSVSNKISNKISKNYNLKVQTLPNCINYNVKNCKISSDHSNLRNFFPFNDEFIFLFVAQGHYARKGFWLLLKALDKFNIKNSNFKLVVVGVKEKKSQLIKNWINCKHPSIKEKVLLVGWVDNVKEYMQASDCLVLLSYFEAFSLVEIEASVLGLPLLLTDHPGVEMILKDGMNGYITGFDHNEVSRTMEKMVLTPPQFQSYHGKALSPRKWAEMFIEIFL